MVDGQVCYRDGVWPGLDIFTLQGEVQTAATYLTNGL